MEHLRLMVMVTMMQEISPEQREQLTREYSGPSQLVELSEKLEIGVGDALFAIYVSTKDFMRSDKLTKIEKDRHACVMHGMDLYLSGGRWT